MNDRARARGPGSVAGSPTSSDHPATGSLLLSVARETAWTADPFLRWDVGQCVAVGAAIGILREIVAGDLDPVYWRARIGHALEALGAAVNP